MITHHQDLVNNNSNNINQTNNVDAVLEKNVKEFSSKLELLLNRLEIMENYVQTSKKNDELANDNEMNTFNRTNMIQVDRFDLDNLMKRVTLLENDILVLKSVSQHYNIYICMILYYNVFLFLLILKQNKILSNELTQQNRLVVELTSKLTTTTTTTTNGNGVLYSNQLMNSNNNTNNQQIANERRSLGRGVNAYRNQMVDQKRTMNNSDSNELSTDEDDVDGDGDDENRSTANENEQTTFETPFHSFVNMSNNEIADDDPVRLNIFRQRSSNSASEQHHQQHQFNNGKQTENSSGSSQVHLRKNFQKCNPLFVQDNMLDDSENNLFDTIEDSSDSNPNELTPTMSHNTMMASQKQQQQQQREANRGTATESDDIFRAHQLINKATKLNEQLTSKY